MKKSSLLWIVVTALLLLTGCATNKGYQKVQANGDLTQENWIRYFNTNPNDWIAHADTWFLRDYPGNVKPFAPCATPNSAMTTAEVRAPNFTRIKVKGPYLVQLYGSDHNSILVFGTNDEVRHTQIQVKGNAIIIRPAPDCLNCGNLNNVIVRIGIRDLQYLYHAGSGLVEGKNIRSHCLVVKSNNMGNVLLVGNMNLLNVVQGGSGTISILGVNSFSTAVNILGNGNVNLFGNVGVSQILKRGCGRLNIISANNSNCLRINASGGLTTVNGIVNLQNISTMGTARVYIYWVNSHTITVSEHDNSRVGLAGRARIMNIGVDGISRFGGKCMRANTIFINTAANGHANVSPMSTMFANARDYSSIYFYSSPPSVSRYSQGQGLIIPIFNDNCAMCGYIYKLGYAYPGSVRQRSCRWHKVKKSVCKIHH